jgi:hypothetical protein
MGRGWSVAISMQLARNKFFYSRMTIENNNVIEMFKNQKKRILKTFTIKK